MGTHPIFESDFDCLTDVSSRSEIMASYKEGKEDMQTGRSRCTKSESPSLQRTVPPSNASLTSSSRLPRTNSSKLRAPSVCQPRLSVLPPERPLTEKVPRPGIAFRCEFTSA